MSPLWSKSTRSYRRGALVVGSTWKDFRPRWANGIGKSMTIGRRAPDLVTLAGVPIDPRDETKHFKLIGVTGTGKSTAIREILGSALERGDRAVIADPDCAYLAQFRNFNRGDVVLNPFEARSVRWDPFLEIQDSYDAEQLASALIASSDDSSGREWRGYARTFVAAVLRRCHREYRRDVAELWNLLLIAPAAQLRPMVAGTPAQPFLEPENARMFASIRSIAGSALAALEFVRDQSGPGFSVRRWIQDGQGVLYLPYRAGQIAALRSMISTWVRLAIFETMEGRERDRRLWFVVDELDALGVIDGLKDALARLRKFGGRCVLGFQSIAQVSGLYGHDAQTIIENCGNTLIFRCSSSERGGTAQFASRLIGDTEVVRTSVSRGRDQHGLFFGPGGRRRSVNVSEQTATEPAVMASELEQLPDLTGYLKRASSRAWVRVAFAR
ncbi:MAG TPA: type IV secretion system DNA-binding domain-containing protein [Steroidobacteraceae bacterium]